jgi:hypothetical protein
MELLANTIDTLSINKKIIQVLNNNGIETVKDLCKCSRMDLANKGLENSEIKNIMITLQLKGLDLKPNHAKKNVLIDQK